MFNSSASHNSEEAYQLVPNKEKNLPFPGFNTIASKFDSKEAHQLRNNRGF